MGGGADRVSSDEAFDTDRGGRLLASEQNFLQALDGPDAGEDDVDIATGFETGKPDHPFSEIDDLHRLTHVEHVNRHADSARFESVACRRDDEIAGLADSHEVPHHLRMCDRERPAAL